ncbi:MAG: hypothetical protein JXD18_10985 [Anaerolineae bacterium]|nr:hypothetical protein [Anaerolineae bacterium]
MKYSIILLSIIAALLTSSVALAQTGGGYDLTWWTVDGGGGTVSSAAYELAGTIGQSDVGVVLSGGEFTLYSGFWSSGTTQYMIYLPLILRGSSS